MSARTPIEAWPPRKLRGRPGYSRRYFEAMAGAPEDPLRVAERQVARELQEQFASERAAKIAAGETIAPDWVSDELGRRRLAAWERLCASFDEVIAALERSPQSPGIRACIREAKRAAKPHEERPLFKDLSDAALLEAYIGTKALAHNGAAIKSPKLGRLLKDLDIIVAVARKRGLQLPAGGAP